MKGGLKEGLMEGREFISIVTSLIIVNNTLVHVHAFSFLFLHAVAVNTSRMAAPPTRRSPRVA